MYSIHQDSIISESFALPGDFKLRKSTLLDKNLYPFNCAYVVAKAMKNIKDDGFGIIYPDPGFNFFPIAHENSNIDKNIKKFDVNCYNFTNNTYNRLKFKRPNDDDEESKNSIS